MQADPTTEELRGWWPLPGATVLRDALLTAYADPSRGYHDQRHLAEVCSRVGHLAMAGEPFDRTEVLLAAWFHDAVYDGRPDAEERSALWAEQALPAVGVAPPTVTEVARLVRLTRDHRPDPADLQGCVLCDADLAILAAPAERYREYVVGVRREYAHVPEELFAAGRAAVLRDLLSRPRLFHTRPARSLWEAAARSNLDRELAELAEFEQPERPPEGGASAGGPEAGHG